MNDDQWHSDNQWHSDLLEVLARRADSECANTHYLARIDASIEAILWLIIAVLFVAVFSAAWVVAL